jgi:hypothetical protein
VFLTLRHSELTLFTAVVRIIFPYYSLLFIRFISRSYITKVRVQT